MAQPVTGVNATSLFLAGAATSLVAVHVRSRVLETIVAGLLL
jgi:hypothetical protein